MWYVNEIVENLTLTIESYHTEMEALDRITELMLETKGWGIKFHVDDEPHGGWTDDFDMRTL